MSAYIGKKPVDVLTYDHWTDTAKYTSRTTADGLEIIDGRLARVKKIQGDTVKSKNIFNLYYGNRTGGSLITETTDEKIIVRQQHDGRTYVSANIPLENPEQYVGKTLYISAKWTCSGANKGAIRVMWLNESSGIAGGTVNETWTSGAVVSGIVPERPANATGLYCMLYSNIDGTAVQGDTVTYTDIMISTENVPYTPYFSGLKHAYIDSIKSIGRNFVNYIEIFNGVSYFTISGDEITVEDTMYAYGSRYSNRFYLPVGKCTMSADAKCKTDRGVFAGFSVYNDDAKTILADYVMMTITKEYTRISRTFTINKAGYYKTCVQMAGDANNYKVSMTFKNLKIAFDDAENKDVYEPYKESIYKLPAPVELKKWDYILPQAQKIVRKTKIVTKPTPFTDEEISQYPNAIVALDKLSLIYEGEETVNDLEMPIGYTAWKDGAETVIQGTNDNSVYGAMPTIQTAYANRVYRGVIQWQSKENKRE